MIQVYEQMLSLAPARYNPFNVLIENPPLENKPKFQGTIKGIEDFINEKIASIAGSTVSETTNALAALRNIQKHADERQMFDLSNGNFILERYIEHTPIPGSPAASAFTGFDEGKISLEKFAEILRDMGQGRIIDSFASVSLGLRITYVPALDPAGFADVGHLSEVQNDLATQAGGDNPVPISIIEKAYNLKEQFEVGPDIRGGAIQGRTFEQPQKPGDPPTAISVERRVATIPLFSSSVSIREDLTLAEFANKVYNAATPQAPSPYWLAKSENLQVGLRNQPEFRFLFEYCFPLDRMMFLVMLYNMTYFSVDKEVINLFTNTKQSLKTVFQTLLNSGDYSYEDPTMKSIGGNKGVMTLAQNNQEIPGIDLIAMAAKTPLLILKGIVELIDPNIGIAKKIHDGALQAGKDLPMPLCSIMGLPMNIIPFMPGPPITPLGFPYLIMDLVHMNMSPEEKQLRKDAMAEPNSGKPDLSLGSAECPTEEE